MLNAFQFCPQCLELLSGDGGQFAGDRSDFAGGLRFLLFGSDEGDFRGGLRFLLFGADGATSVVDSSSRGDHLLRHQRLEQYRFTPGKSTTDRILAL